jgi:putative membrane protein
MFLTNAEANAIAARIAAIEARTGIQVVVAVVGRAARYPEARWKAFALAVTFAAAGVVAWTWLQPGWGDAGATFGGIVAILGAGIASALIATWSARCERLFVRHNRAEAEVRQHAEGLFLARDLFATPSRTAVLLVVSLFERVVVVHADRGFADRVAASDWDDVVVPMTVALRAGQRAGAVQAGLDTLDALLAGRGFVATGAVANALPDRPLEERGA